MKPSSMAVRSSYWHSVFSVLNGVILAQAIPILGSLLITRLYAPDDFGVFSTWLGISLILTVSVTHRLEAAVGLEPDGKTRAELVLATVIVTLLTGMILAIIGFATLSLLDVRFGMPAPFILLLIPQSVGAALSMIWQSWAANNGDIKKLSIIRISQAFLITTLQILAGLVNPTAQWLSAAQTLGVWVTVMVCLCIMPLRITLPSNLKVLVHLVARYWKKYRRFPALSLPAGLINTAALQLPIIVIGNRFGAEIAGYYALATRMMGAPIFILGGAVRDVFIRSANEELRKFGNCRAIYKRTFLVLSALSVLMVIVTIPFAELIFTLFFGEKWSMAGVIAGWLVPMYALRFMASPLSYTFYVVQKQNIDLLWQIGLFAMAGLTLLAFDSHQQTLIWYSAGHALMYLIYLVLSYRYSVSNDAIIFNKAHQR